ncbi:hypothetical protein PAMP_016828 [Pampus punctatissimus]
MTDRGGGGGEEKEVGGSTRGEGVMVVIKEAKTFRRNDEMMGWVRLRLEAAAEKFLSYIEELKAQLLQNWKRGGLKQKWRFQNLMESRCSSEQA